MTRDPVGTIGAFTPQDWRHLRVLAARYSKPGIEPDDLLQETIFRIIKGKILCPIDKDVRYFIAATMRRVAKSWGSKQLVLSEIQIDPTSPHWLDFLDKSIFKGYIPNYEPEPRADIGDRPHGIGGQTEGPLPNDNVSVSPEKGIQGLALFMAAFGDTKSLDDASLAEAALIAAKRRIVGRPKWLVRKNYENLRHLNAARFLKTVYPDLIEGGEHLPDGGRIWHLVLPTGHPVWQEAIRSYDSTAVQMVHVYLNGRGSDLGDAEGLTFEKKVHRPSGKKAKSKQQKPGKRFELG